MTAAVLLVRHALAGSRQDWDGPDFDRPLSKRGRAQAQSLVRLLADRPVTSVHSSPYVRCVQTVEPLAEARGLRVEPAPQLAEGAAAADAVDFVRGLAGTGAVLCTHGDMVPVILDALAAADGLVLPPRYPFAKGSTWELQAVDGRWVGAHYLPPPPD